MEFLYKSKNAVCVIKPVGVPAQSDPTGDKDIMTMTAEELSALGEASDLWLVHRLDRVVGGVTVFAREKSTAAELSLLMANDGTANKEYLAVIEGEITDGVMEDYLYHDKLKGKAFITDRERRGVKYCRLEAETLSVREGKSLVRVRLYTGRFHQIRAQLSIRGCAIIGDKKYGSRDRTAHFPALFAYKLNLKMKNEEISVKALPDIKKYPWSIFADVMEYGI